MNDPQYPQGKITPDDEGAVNIAIAADPTHRVVRIVFPKPIAWLALEKQEALELAKVIRRRAEELP